MFCLSIEFVHWCACVNAYIKAHMDKKRISLSALSFRLRECPLKGVSTQRLMCEHFKGAYLQFALSISHSTRSCCIARRWVMVTPKSPTS